MKKRIQSVGFGYNDVTRDLNRAVWEKRQNSFVPQINDAWRKALDEDPGLEYRMTFMDFRREWFKKNVKKNSKKSSVASRKKSGNKKSKNSKSSEEGGKIKN